MTDHLGELAALYALGNPRTARSARGRGTLARLRRMPALARASASRRYRDGGGTAAVRSDRCNARRRAQRRAYRVTLPRMALAFAAALVIMLLPVGYLLEENLSMHQAMASDTAAMARVATSPHRTVAFSGTDAHVMYGTGRIMVLHRYSRRDAHRCTSCGRTTVSRPCSARRCRTATWRFSTCPRATGWINFR